VQDFEGVAVEDGDDEAGKFCERGIRGKEGGRNMSGTVVLSCPAWKDEVTGIFYFFRLVWSIPKCACGKSHVW
jgi:hypothetical protein